VRVRWWDPDATTYRSAAIMGDGLSADLPDTPIPARARVPPVEKPTFFGHYWLTGTPTLMSSRAACLDYSAGRGGPLVAYRFGGESELSAEQLVSVG
jgi:hypothetical protein